MFAYDAMQTMKQKKGEWERQKRALNHRKLIDIAREFVSNIKIKCKKKTFELSTFTNAILCRIYRGMLDSTQSRVNVFFSIHSSYKSFTWMLLTLILMFTILNSFAFSCSIYHHHQNAFGKLLSYASWLFSCSVLLYAFPFAYWTPVSIQSLRHSSNSTIHNKTETSDDLIKSACTGSDRNVVI